MNTFRKSLMFALAAIFMLVQGCSPRGETMSLDQVLNAAKARFAQASPGTLSGKAAESVKALTRKLEQIEAKSGADAVAPAGELSALLSQLASSAGYTSRPSMGELALQFGMMGAAAPPKPGTPEVKLLVARTYALLASELETTRFMY